MEDKLKQVEEILDKRTSEFLENINFISEISSHRGIRKQTPNFQILEPGNEEFYQYAYYERALESLIRERLINPALSDLFHLFDIHAFWPDHEGKIIVNASNETIDDEFFCQFSIEKEGKEIGYRYSTVVLYEDESLSDILEEVGLDSVVEIDWKINISKHNQNEDLGVRHISVKQFFDEVFPPDVYPIFLSKAQRAVSAANEDIGFQTIPRLSLRYLSSFKADISDLLNSTDYKAFRYQVLAQNASQANKYSNLAFSEDDYLILDKNFKKRCDALVGTKDFAKSFVTAEYMYQIIKAGNNLDYTSVVSGYFKSVEQLVYEIMLMNLEDSKETDNHWISGVYKGKEDRSIMSRNNPTTNKPQVKFLSRNLEYFNITLAPLLWCLYDNDLYILSNEGAKIAHSLLRRYADECRNDHSHKDNIDSFNDVECIRHDAHLVLYLLLGGCKMTGNDISDYNRLGIIDNDFDNLYKRLIEIPRSVAKFKIQFGAEQPIYVRRLFEQEKPIYQESGSLSTSKIKFVSEEKYSKDCEIYGTADIILSSDNIPSKVWFIKRGGEEVEIEW